MPLLASTITAAVVGYLSIWFLIAFLRKNSTGIFIVYRVIVGAAILIALWFGFLNPTVN
jgi:undecaprenyl-diphosphatase